MSPEVLGLVMISLMVVSIMIGFPTAFTLMSLGVTFGFLGIGFVVFDLVVQRTFFLMQNDVLVAIPLFLFMGYVIERAGIVDVLFHAVDVMFGWLPGSLAAPRPAPSCPASRCPGSTSVTSCSARASVRRTPRCSRKRTASNSPRRRRSS